MNLDGIKLKEWKVWGTYMEDAVFFHVDCGHIIYSEIDSTLKTILLAVKEHSKECKK